VPKFAMLALLSVKNMMKNYVKLAPKHVENVQQPAENAVNEKLLWYKKILMPQ
tara:strand:- start:568 stop:726 length:159 start_codon:yes stop_codon:yes gene_type:complete